MSKNNTLYAILGIDDKASSDNIASAYEMHMTRLKHAGDHDSRNEKKLIRHAFEVLSDSEQRKKYDQRLKTEAMLSNTVIYYSNETRHGGGGMRWLLAAFVLAITAYLASQHYFPDSSVTVANVAQASGNSDPDKEPMDVVIREAGTGFVPAGDAQGLQSALVRQSPVQAAGNNINVVPAMLAASQRHAYLFFLSQHGPRAFVICGDGKVLTFLGSEHFVARRLSVLPDGCRPYAVNNVVVWGSGYINHTGS